MNQKNLYIAIVAVVAIAVVIGLWLTGAGQNRPLSGEIGKDPVLKTTLTVSLDRSTCHAINFEVRGGTIRGTLLDNSGMPLAGKTIEIYVQGDASSGWTAYYRSPQTLEDGSFSYNVDWVNSLNYDFKASFPGDADHLPSEAFIWDVYC